MKTAQDHDHISYSQINQYTTCPLKYRFSYIDGLEPEFKSSALLFGSAMHAGIQAYLQSALEGDHLRPDQLLDVYRGEWKISNGAPIRYSGRGESEDSLLKKAGELFGLFVDQYDLEAEVIAVEEAFTIDLNELTPDSSGKLPPFVGYVDAIIQNGSTALIDYKTSSRKPNGDVNADATGGIQLGSHYSGLRPE